jgi:dTDP-4-dehydrorhamnose 3,5-epimerase
VRFEALAIEGVVRVRLDRHSDERGSFARAFCTREFALHGLPGAFVQSSLSHNRLRGTVRGLHFQRAPSAEGKLVRCVRGRLLDLALDLRPASSTYRQWLAVELDCESADALYLPPGVAHGFQTLEDATDVLYQMSDVHAPELAEGLRWNDPAFGIRLPLPVSVISERDANYPLFDPARFAQAQTQTVATA